MHAVSISKFALKLTNLAWSSVMSIACSLDDVLVKIRSCLGVLELALRNQTESDVSPAMVIRHPSDLEAVISFDFGGDGWILHFLTGTYGSSASTDIRVERRRAGHPRMA